MPSGALVTVPVPLPALVSVSVVFVGEAVNVAVTTWLPFMATTHDPVPLQPPSLQPENVEPLAAVAVSVTSLPVVKAPEALPQPSSQLIPAGELVTVPIPLPALFTVNVVAVVVALNVAV